MTTDAERREATDQWAIQLREQQLRELRVQLAIANEARQQLQDALHVRDTQLAAATAERDDYIAKFRDLEHELQLERGQVVLMQQRAETAEATIAAANRIMENSLEVSRQNTAKIDEIIERVTAVTAERDQLQQRADAAESALRLVTDSTPAMAGFSLAERREISRLNIALPH